MLNYFCKYGDLSSNPIQRDESQAFKYINTSPTFCDLKYVLKLVV